MASEKLVIELWEIVQKENNEKISYDVFENDLNDALNLPRDEVDRALALMLSQAEVNPNLIGEYKGGSFVISSSFAATITTTIKYENQFIPGKEEYNARMMTENFKEDILPTFFILSPQLFDSMIENYNKLSDGEVEKLWANYSELSSDSKSKLIQAHNDKLREVLNDPNTPQEEKEEVKKAIEDNNKRDAMQKAADNGDPFAEKKLRDRVKAMQARNPELFKEVFPDYEDVDSLSMDIIKTLCEVDDQFAMAMQRNAHYQKDSSRFPQNEKGSIKLTGQQRKHIFQNFGKLFKGKDSIDFDEKLETLFMAANNNKYRTTILSEPEDYVYYMGMVNNAIGATGVSEVSYVETIFEALKAIPLETLEDGSVNIGKQINKYLAKNYDDSQMKEFAIKFNNSELAALIYEGFKEDREGVISKVLDPFLKGIKDGKTFEEIVKENFTDVDTKKKEAIVRAYRNRERINTNKGFKNIGSDNIIVSTTITGKNGKPITEAELESGIKKLSEDMIVDNEGLKMAEKGAKMTYDTSESAKINSHIVNTDSKEGRMETYTSMTEIGDTNDDNSDFTIFNDVFGDSGFTEGKNTTGGEVDKPQGEISESENSEVVEEQQEEVIVNELVDKKIVMKQEVGERKDKTFFEPSERPKKQSKLSFFNPRIKEAQQKIFGMLRNSTLKSEADILRESILAAEKKTGVKLAADFGDETREE